MGKFKINIANILNRVEYNSNYYHDYLDPTRELQISILTNVSIARIKKYSVSDVEINKVYLDKKNKLKEKFYKVSTVEKYCVDRLLRIYKTYDKNLYSAITSCDEILGVWFEHEAKLIDSIENLLNLETDIEKIKFVLSEEYSHPLDTIKCTQRVYEQTLDISAINLDVDYLSRHKKDVSLKTYNFEENVPVGIVGSFGGSYIMVDGYHRFLSLRGQNIEKACYFVIE
jgi:hypothetical protein